MKDIPYKDELYEWWTKISEERFKNPPEIKIYTNEEGAKQWEELCKLLSERENSKNGKSGI